MEDVFGREGKATMGALTPEAVSDHLLMKGYPRDEIAYIMTKIRTVRKGPVFSLVDFKKVYKQVVSAKRLIMAMQKIVEAIAFS